MAIKDLREFIALVEAKGQLRRVTAPVDPALEVGEIADRVSKKLGPALLFERPVNRATGESYAMPVAINLMGSYERMAWALGVDAETG
ncbi:MAG: 3-octaprenyl-4-hydroxybenzoate decarboxylase, partial [Anaerolineales bacterium]|nr:3-octaprenyl-4-hydroxybenzoate decarboxylase [Anaerolineales bacterium]